MKNKDLEFRIVKKNGNGVSFIYGNEAKAMLGEIDDDAEIQLWTGVVDAKGVKIYDGDIIWIGKKDTFEIFKVVFNKGFFEFQSFDGSRDLLGLLCVRKEVIGNINKIDKNTHAKTTYKMTDKEFDKFLDECGIGAERFHSW